MLRENDVAIAADFTFEEFTHLFEMPGHPNHAPHKLAECGEVNRHDSSWYGGLTSLADATRLLTEGWRDGSNRLQQMVRDIQVPAARTRTRRVQWSDQGDELQLDRALRGDWDRAWRTSRRQWSGGPQSITLLTKWGGNSHQDAEQLFWQGAAVAVLTDLLESAGYRVRVVAGTPMNSAYGESRFGGILVTVKEESEPMRLDALAAVACHAGIFRTYGFRAIMSTTHNLSSHAKSEWIKDDIAMMRDLGAWPDNVVTIGEATNRQAAVNQINRVLTQVNQESANE